MQKAFFLLLFYYVLNILIQKSMCYIYINMGVGISVFFVTYIFCQQSRPKGLM